MRARLTFFALALLAAGLPFPAGASEPAEVAMRGAPLEVGARGDYVADNGLRLNVSIHPPTQILDRAGRETDAYVLHHGANLQQDWIAYVSPVSFTLEEMDMTCAGVDDQGHCLPVVERDWTVQGVPALFGATVVQGREFRVGDTWLVEGDCPSCAAPTQVRVEAPRSSSPSGTDYVLNLTFHHRTSRGYYTEWQYADGLLHMSLEHAFPLRVENPRFHALHLVAYAPGHTTIPAHDVRPARYDPVLQPAPFQDGYPVEGPPLRGWLPWEDARNATGANGAAPGTFHDIHYARLSVPTSLGGGLVRVDHGARFQYTETFSRPGLPHAVAVYETTRDWLLPPSLDVAPEPGWSRHETSDAHIGWTGCADEAVPIFDGVRHVLQFSDLVTEARAVRLTFFDCQEASLTVHGASQDGVSESLSIDPRTGLLRVGRDWLTPSQSPLVWLGGE